MSLAALTPAQREQLRREEDNKRKALAAIPGLTAPVEEGNFIYLTTDVADPGADCWSWLRGFIDLAYKLIKANRLYEVRVLFTFERWEKR